MMASVCCVPTCAEIFPFYFYFSHNFHFDSLAKKILIASWFYIFFHLIVVVVEGVVVVTFLNIIHHI